MQRRVALVGMYGGYFGERNPGCFLILEAALRALGRRLPDASFDIYSEDAIGRFHGVRSELVHGRELRYFSSQWGQTLLATSLMGYDALVLGGDIILAPPPAPSVFLLESPAFLAAPSPPVFYNAAHSALSREEIVDGFHTERLRGLCKRADYVGVRTEHVRDALRELGCADKVAFCPDPTLSLDLHEVLRGIEVPRLKREKKILGLSVMAHFVEGIVDAIAADPSFLDEYDLWVYPYSRQYNHIEAVLRIQQKYGDRFHYIERYQDPLATFALMAQFDASINDTYHGTIAALLAGIPFLVIDREDEVRSRSRNLLRLFSWEDRIVTARRHGLTDPADDGLLLGDALVERWRGPLQTLREQPRGDSSKDLGTVRAIIDAHFDRIAHGIAASSGLTDSPARTGARPA
ncbi:polysaccharide pyruvyl transferase family protein [Nannocystis sp. RBIL2]|uniref:polysaccharide pyruvyl transferase family protein n=1 Tax=Nannocystis sp. RBIL2 TaxID=2996788 RepID=UPI002270DA20|nr:polysaccharide pyruvyl transferase family protein [Nannocystis sp. RBIL2]MCY1072261.1 polysaccharide pyruvyl transferase family protein [Nannocystis sp. RBIL2]